MKALKRISAALLAVMMIVSVGVVLAAGENTGSSDYNGSTGHPYAQQDDNQFSIKKEILLFNVDTSPILDPNVVFTYQISAVDVGAPTVTGYVLNDNTKTTTTVVKDGIAGAVTIQGRKVNAITGTDGAGATVSGAVSSGDNDWKTTITFGGDNSTKHNTKDEGTSITASDTAVTTGYIDVVVDEAAIYAANKGPGIYRYKISDVTTAGTLKNAGIIRSSNYVTDLYLDVYLKNDDANNDGTIDTYKVYGYVLFKADNANLNILLGSGITSETNKVDGFTVLSEVGLVDQYHTYNVEVTKSTTGDLADKRNLFPFEIGLNNTGITSQDDFYYVVTSNGTAGSATSANLDSTGAWSIGDATTTPANSALKFKDGDGIIITGLPVCPDTTPVYTTITVKEYNNTTDVYTASAKDEANATINLTNNAATPVTNAASVQIAGNLTAQLHTAKNVDYADSNDIVAITNNIDTISPTGYVTRFAPYALILVGGIVLLIISKKHKKNTDED